MTLLEVSEAAIDKCSDEISNWNSKEVLDIIIPDLPSFPLYRKIFLFFRFFYRKSYAFPLCFENLPLFKDFAGDRSATRRENTKSHRMV